MLIDLVFYAEYESDVEFCFRVGNETQNNQFTFDNNLEISQFFGFNPFCRPETKKRRKPDIAADRASFALSTHICR